MCVYYHTFSRLTVTVRNNAHWNACVLAILWTTTAYCQRTHHNKETCAIVSPFVTTADRFAHSALPHKWFNISIFAHCVQSLVRNNRIIWRRVQTISAPQNYSFASNIFSFVTKYVQQIKFLFWYQNLPISQPKIAYFILKFIHSSPRNTQFPPKISPWNQNFPELSTFVTKINQCKHMHSPATHLVPTTVST